MRLFWGNSAWTRSGIHEDEQAEMLGWHIDSVVKCGLAGTIFFTWTDEWFTGGRKLPTGRLGSLRGTPTEESVLHAGRETGTNGADLPHLLTEFAVRFGDRLFIQWWPDSCLCLDLLGKLNYPEYEVILVDDGSTDDTSYIAAQFPWVRYIHQSNQGLSHARNTGAAAAKGEVFAYTDSDCMVDPDWLYYLIGTLVSGDYAGVGGPNVTPPAKNWIQACVAAAPGGPSHVLLTDVVAEHIPGCNMAFIAGRLKA